MRSKDIFVNCHPSGFLLELWFPGKGGCTPVLGSPRGPRTAERPSGGADEDPRHKSPRAARLASAGPGLGASRLEPGGLPGLLTAAFDKAPLCMGWGGPAGWSQHTSGGQHRPGAAGAADSGATLSHTPGPG